jgi:hypothetical protein
MFIKCNQGPVEVALPNGAKLNRSDLPPKTTTRWVASRKLVVVQAVTYGLIDFDEACSSYALSEEELNSWIKHVNDHGPTALKVTKIPKYRQP